MLILSKIKLFSCLTFIFKFLLFIFPCRDYRQCIFIGTTPRHVVHIANNKIIYKILSLIIDNVFKSLLGFLGKSIVKKDIFYKVCIAEFTDICDAVKLSNTAISKGFSNSYIIS